MLYAVIVNRNAGTVRALGRRTVEELIQGRLKAGVASLQWVQGGGIVAACRSALASGAEALAVLGGDGTCATAASFAVYGGAKVALLPGGTMNILSRRLWGNRSLEDTFDLLAKDKVQLAKLDMGLANEHPFFVAATFGLVSALTIMRERVRTALIQGHMGGALARMVRGPRGVLRPMVRYSLDPDRAPDRAAGLIVTIGNADVLLPGAALEAETGLFECVSIKARGWGDVGRLLFEAITHNNWRRDKRIRDFRVRSLWVSEGERTSITLDGEPRAIRGPVYVEYRPKGLPVLAPAT